jgi:hypothetical protein
MATLFVAGSQVSGQSATGGTPAGATASFSIPRSTYAPPKTPWGDPDIQGIYDNHNIIPMERPANLGDKKTFTDIELAAFAADRGAGRDNVCVVDTIEERCRNATVAQVDNVGGYNGWWTPRDYVKDNRTSLIVDPPNGRIPALTPEAIARRDAYIKLHPPSNEGVNRAVEIKHWEDFDLITRCIATQVPTGIMGYNSASYIMQSPGWVMIALERLNTRMIPLDGRPHLEPGMGGWLGDSRGHFEGNTLVVETTSYTNRQSGGGVGSSVPAGTPFGNVKVVEHFVPVSQNVIHYYATLEDPKTWARPWTFMQPWEKGRVLAYNDSVGSVKGKVTPYQMYEYACHEGNESLGIAMIATFTSRREGQAAAKPPTSESVSSLIGNTESDVRTKFGEPVEIAGPRWEFQTDDSIVPLYVFFEGGKVVRVRPDDLRLNQVVRAR